MAHMPMYPTYLSTYRLLYMCLRDSGERAPCVEDKCYSFDACAKHCDALQNIGT